jgi:hypothetical protein
MGVSIPLPADCEPTALPSELIPLVLIGKLGKQKLNGGTGIRARVERITTANANHYTIPPAHNSERFANLTVTNVTAAQRPKAKKKLILRSRELNPGLLRDRQEY